MNVGRHAAILSLALFAGSAVAQQPMPASARLHGTVEKADATSLVLRERDGREISLPYADDLRITEIVPIDPTAIQEGSFIGTTAVPGPDGKLSALEVHVFPESARGTGDQDCERANARPALQGRRADGPSTRRVPVVAQKPGDRSLLVPGAKVTVIEQMRDGKAVATRIQVGSKGFTPPT
jgi:hypothetical protein